MIAPPRERSRSAPAAPRGSSTATSAVNAGCCSRFSRAGRIQVVEDFVAALPDQRHVSRKRSSRSSSGTSIRCGSGATLCALPSPRPQSTLRVGRTINEGVHNERVRLTKDKLRRHSRARRIRPGVDLERHGTGDNRLGLCPGVLVSGVARARPAARAAHRHRSSRGDQPRN